MIIDVGGIQTWANIDEPCGHLQGIYKLVTPSTISLTVFLEGNNSSIKSALLFLPCNYPTEIGQMITKSSAFQG